MRSFLLDIDECALGPHLCAPNGKCENMLGYYMCLCDSGYEATADAQKCVGKMIYPYKCNLLRPKKKNFSFLRCG